MGSLEQEIATLLTILKDAQIASVSWTLQVLCRRLTLD